MMNPASLNGLFSSSRPLIGMVHLLPLPGSPGFAGDLATVIARAVADARLLQEAGFDAVIVENFADTPYCVGPGPLERTVAMTILVGAVRQAVEIPIGVNVQFNDYAAELTIARYGGAQFIRVEAFVDSVMTAGGPAYACAPALTRLAASLSGPPVHIFADIHVKESVPIASPSLAASARNAELAGAHALIVTGSATGAATPLDAVEEAKRATALPVFVGSGMTPRTAVSSLGVADGAIVGTATKRGGVATNPVERELAREFVHAARAEPQLGHADVLHAVR
jgi:membrane complex biogenesis BtpA family protein